MHTFLRFPARCALFVLSVSCLLLAGTVSHSSANDESAGTASITFEQKSMSQALGTLTLLEPNQETVTVTTAASTATALSSGKYTLFVASPNGTSTTIRVVKGASTIASADTPQVSFDVGEGDQLHVAVEYHLVSFGLVGVSSDPAGIPFELRGPNDFLGKGITPKSFETMPIGEYAVTYKPRGCLVSPARSNRLEKNGHAYFSITIKCDSLQVVNADPSSEPDGSMTSETVIFDDVPRDAWFAPFVYKVTRFGIMSGYRDASGNLTGHFGSSAPVTLAELAKITHSVLGIDEDEYSGIPDNPSARAKWYSNYVVSAEKRDWRIYSDPTLSLDRPATRAEILVTLLQVMDTPLQWPKGSVFKDVTRRTRYASAVETAAAMGFVSGKANASGKQTGFFGPEEPVTRAEFSKILTVVMEKFRGASSSISSLR
ncbi:S-layer homology domain-containing protein [Candidatus Peregrinibacteria bacterium]|nr:S-layer homology domain-containing protein [Candidatus Peregrinibacteria bacterium]MBI3816816.1 S-layer homology domain-containing protein [Candidatus Peregrinibacteria bacterium]